jgi:hypothetical protein
METRCEPDNFATTSSPHGTLAFVLMAYFFLDAISAAIVRAHAQSDLAGVFVFAVFASQAVLLVMWVGLGNVAIWIRLLCAVAWCGWIVVLGTAEAVGWDLELLAAVGLMLLVAAAPYGVLKVLGFRFLWRSVPIEKRWRRDILQQGAIFESIGPPININEPAEHPADAQPGPRAGVQFSLVQIFAWTALAGIMAVLVRIAGIRLEEAIAITIPVIVASAVGLTTLWAVLGGEQVGARLFAAFVVVFLVTLIAAAFAGPAPSEFFVTIFSSLALATAAVALVLGLFRSAGYRVRRANRAFVHRPAVLNAPLGIGRI